MGRVEIDFGGKGGGSGICCWPYQTWVLVVSCVMLLLAVVGGGGIFARGMGGIYFVGGLMYVGWVLAAIFGILATTCVVDQKLWMMMVYCVVIAISMLLTVVSAIISLVELDIVGIVSAIIAFLIDFFFFYVGYHYRGGLSC